MIIDLCTTYNKHIECTDLGNGIYLYTSTVKTNVDGKEDTKTVRGLATMNEISKTTASTGISSKFSDNEYLALISKKLLSDFVSGQIDFFRVEEEMSEYNETEILSEPCFSDNYEIVLLRSYSHDILDLNGEPYPHRIRFDYIEGIHDGNYNLPELLSYLRANPSRFTVKNGIKEIPSYNHVPGRENFIEFYFIPSKDEYSRIYHAGEITKKRELVQEIAGFLPFRKH